jgi:hypothetical protein
MNSPENPALSQNRQQLRPAFLYFGLSIFLSPTNWSARAGRQRRRSRAKIDIIYIMSTPISPRLLEGRIVLLDPESGTVQRVTGLQYSAATDRMWKASSNP